MRATDEGGAIVSTSIKVDVAEVPPDTMPTSDPMPDRTFQGQYSYPLIAVDLWSYFHDAETPDEDLVFSATVTDSSAFDMAPMVDPYGFLLYRPTSTPSYSGSSDVEVTADGIKAGNVKVSADGVVKLGKGGAGVANSATCPDGNCNQTCEAGKKCNFECTGGGCTQVCHSGSNCQLACSGEGCKQQCRDGSTCNMGCTGGACEQACRTGASCNLACTGGKCQQACDKTAGKCNKSCSGGGC